MFAAAADAGQVCRETFHEEETVVLEDFCDVPGLTVELAFVADGRSKRFSTASKKRPTSSSTSAGPRCTRISLTASPSPVS
jgi:hypothetical protein